MADEPEKLDLAKISEAVATTKAPEYRNIYVNSSRMGVSPWDVRITVGVVVEAGSGQVNQDEATLIMSPQHAKAFVESVGKTIAAYEENFGPIPELGPAFAKAAAKAAANAARGVPGLKPTLRRLKKN